MRSVSNALEGCKNQDVPVEEKNRQIKFLVGRYLKQALQKSREELRRRGATKRMADEEDLAVAALSDILLGLKNGKFPDVSNREDFWKLLQHAITQDARNLSARERSQKRDVRREEGSEGLDQVRRAASGNLPGDPPRDRELA
jgi:hypothetical protein